MNPIYMVTGGTAVLCAFLALFAAISGRAVLACAFAGVSAGALSIGQQIG